MNSFVEIKRRLSLLTVMDHYVGDSFTRTFKPKGRLMQGLCPFHPEKTGSFFIYPDQEFYCFGCGASGDIFSFVGKCLSISRPIDQLRQLDEDFNSNATVKLQEHPPTKEKALNCIDFLPYFHTMQQNASLTDYWERRGLTLETVKRFMLGFDPAFIHPKHWGSARPKYVAPYAIIPVSRHSFVARAVRAGSSVKKMRAGYERLFNLKMFKVAIEPAFVVEGEIDAMTIVQAGRTALSIGGVQGISALLNFVRDNRPGHPLIIGLDNDEAGQAATEKLCNGLYGLEINFVRPKNLYGCFKDASEFFMKDPQQFLQAIQNIQK